MNKYLRNSSSKVDGGNQQFGQMIKWWEEQLRGRLWYYLHNLQEPLDRTKGEMRRMGSMWYMRWIYLLKVLWKERYFQREWFLCSIWIGSQILKSNFHLTVHSGALTCNESIKFYWITTTSMHWLKIFQFFLCVFTWSWPSPNYDGLLSAWFFLHGNLT